MKRTSVLKKEQVFSKENSIFSKIKTILFRYPTREFTLSEMASKAGIAKSAASKVINQLRKRDFVKVTDLKVVYRIRANLESDIYKKEKISSNLSTIIHSDITEKLVERFKHPKCIILFGSYRKGEDDEGSDVDIAVEVPQGEKAGIFEFEEFRELGKQIERKIIVHVFIRKEVDKNLFANIVNGIVLYGFLEASK